MKFFLAIFKYFPYGGLQQDMLKFAKELRRRNQTVEIVCSCWTGERPPSAEGIAVRVLRTKSRSNHGAALEFETLFHALLADERKNGTRFRSFAFSRIGFCDFYYAGDNCYLEKMRKRFLRPLLSLLPRYRIFASQEEKIFRPGAKTTIFTIAAPQKNSFRRIYQTEDNRLFALPPGVLDSFSPDRLSHSEKLAKRKELSIPPDALVLLFVAANFQLKGADRVLRGAGMLPEELKKKLCLLMVGSRKQQKRLTRFAERCGLAHALRLPGARNDMDELMAISDLMFHPAREEAAGNALAEGVASGLPVLCTDCCGFADLVRASGGSVIESPYTDSNAARLLMQMLQNLQNVRQTVLAFRERNDLSGRYRCAVDKMLDNTEAQRADGAAR